MSCGNMEEGFVFNIQHYSIHDGPGIRTTVFLNGCPLRCVWCQNPESQPLSPQLFLVQEKCSGCGACVSACPQKAIVIKDGRSQTDRRLCKGCGECAEVCPVEARVLMGKRMMAEEVFRDVQADAVFYEHSGGGVTISGGDPVSQPGFTSAILKLCKEAGLQTAIETSGFAKWEVLRRILEHTDIVLYDLKHMDSQKHREYTGVTNNVILENATRIVREFPGIAFTARMPLIPGYNDTRENVVMTVQFIKNLGDAVELNVLPYHKMGTVKHERLEDAAGTLDIEPPSEAAVESVRQQFEALGVNVK